MADHTKIEWTDSTWTPIRARNKETGGVGHYCVHVSEGCRNCYAERLQPRFRNPIRYAAQDAAAVDLFLDEKVLVKPLQWRKPRMIFVCSMTDLFADFVPNEWIDRVFAVMALAPQHCFQLLTKRSDRMREYLNTGGKLIDRITAATAAVFTREVEPCDWPLPNVHLYVSCEDQERANERIPDLLATPAAVRGVSLEPLIGPISLRWLAAFPENAPRTAMHPSGRTNHLDGLRRLDHVIIGGESGHGARPCNTAWFRPIVDECRGASVPCFVKQLGGHVIQDGERRIKKSKKGGDMSEWPHDIRVREMPR